MVIEIELRVEDNKVHVTASGSRSERPERHSLGAELAVEKLEMFAKKVGAALRKGVALDDAIIDEARRIHGALFQGELRDVVARAS